MVTFLFWLFVTLVIHLIISFATFSLVIVCDSRDGNYRGFGTHYIGLSMIPILNIIIVLYIIIYFSGVTNLPERYADWLVDKYGKRNEKT